MNKQKTSGKWQMQPVLTLSGDYYTITRVVNRRRVHLEYASDGKPMLWGRKQAEEAIAKAVLPIEVAGVLIDASPELPGERAYYAALAPASPHLTSQEPQ